VISSATVKNTVRPSVIAVTPLLSATVPVRGVVVENCAAIGPTAREGGGLPSPNIDTTRAGRKPHAQTAAPHFVQDLMLIMTRYLGATHEGPGLDRACGCEDRIAATGAAPEERSIGLTLHSVEIEGARDPRMSPRISRNTPAGRAVFLLYKTRTAPA
jgi:hypothetical protein